MAIRITKTHMSIQQRVPGECPVHIAKFQQVNIIINYVQSPSQLIITIRILIKIHVS